MLSVAADPFVPQRFLWLGTDGGGLNRFDKETESFDAYTTDHDLPGNSIGSILSDDFGNLWLGTDQGISKVVLEKNSRDVIRFRNYDFQDGLNATNFCFFYGHNAFKNSQGEMFFTGTDGFNIFHPNYLNNPTPPPVKITNFQINFMSIFFQAPDSPLQAPLSKTEKIVLPYEDNTFSFELAALDFHTPEKNLYAYKLEGFQKDWTGIGNNRTALFTQVPPGKYTFRAKASNNDGVWNEEGVSLKIIINPPWYRTWWAYGFYGLFILGIIYGLRRYENSRREATHKLELKNVEAKKLQELDQIKSRFFANISHEFRTPLTLILGPLEKFLSKTKDQKDKQDMTLAQRNAKRLLKLINELLDLSKLESGQMTLRASQLEIIQSLKNNLAFFESSANDRGIKLKFSSEQESVTGFFDEDKLQKIFTNLISNAIKFTQEGGEVLVSVSPLPTIPPLPRGEIKGGVRIIISDTGIGIPKDRIPQIFDRFYQATEGSAFGMTERNARGIDDSSTKNIQGSGIGLALTKELVELHHGTIHAESQEGKGTTFTVQLPLGNNHLKPEEILETLDQPITNAPMTNQPVSSIQYKESNIEQPASSTRYSKSSYENPTTSNQHPATRNQIQF